MLETLDPFRFRDLFKLGEVFDPIATVTQIKYELGKRIEDASQALLHAVNLPSASDVVQIGDQHAAMERKLREISKRLDEVNRVAKAD